MKIIAVTNIKGGVGKTTTAVNLAFLSASENVLRAADGVAVPMLPTPFGAHATRAGVTARD